MKAYLLYLRDCALATTLQNKTKKNACPMPSLLERLAAPGCAKVGSQWDRCGVHYVEPIETNR